jgi:arsenite/tail-anchored protein-transporting ATPase
MLQLYDPAKLNLKKYIFFTGKGGVGKTSTACATAVTLADSGNKVLLISTDPASNLQDVFETKLDNKGVEIKGVTNLTVLNLDPIQAAYEYKESVVGPYKGKLPESVIKNMEEQLSGACTVEIAAFNEFSNYLTNKELESKYDYIIFDTAPTGHTLRMLQLPSAWSSFISGNQHGASCLGQLAGLEDKKEMYKDAVKNLADAKLTTLVLIARPEYSPLFEANKTSHELKELGVNNQILVINGIFEGDVDLCDISNSLLEKQTAALQNIPQAIKNLPMYKIPLRDYNVMGLENIRLMLNANTSICNDQVVKLKGYHKLSELIEYLSIKNKKVIFTMGKGGVGKTTLAASIALGLVAKGKKVHLTTTDPANHLNLLVKSTENLTLSSINPEEALARYKQDILAKAKGTMSKEDLAYIEEDLRSPCTQEIAIFHVFANIVDKCDEEVVVIDTAPTGHTLLLLDATESYHKEIERIKGDMPETIKNLLPRLRNPQKTEVIIVTLPEATPVYEAQRLEEDLKRAGIHTNWWIVNSSFSIVDTDNRLLQAKAKAERTWINTVYDIANGNVVLLPWIKENITVEALPKFFE